MASHSALGVSGVISEEEKNSFRLIKLAYCTARHVLYTVFVWGTQQLPGQTLEEYFLVTKKYSTTRYKNYFDSSQRQKMTSTLLESTLDISHLYKLITHVCGKMDFKDVDKKDDGSLERVITAVKNFRNTVSHSTLGITKERMMEKIDELRELLEKSLYLAGTLYDRDPDEVSIRTDEMKEDIKNIRDQPLAQSDITQYEKDLLNEKLREKVKKQGSEELKKRYRNWSQINPVSFLEGDRMFLKVSAVFTQIEVQSLGNKGKGSLVPYESILSLCMDNASAASSSSINTPEIFLVEGPAGAGKTTLTKLMLSEWCAGSGSIQGLGNYDLLLYMECRNFSISSFSQLLSHLLPHTNANHFSKGDLLKYALDLRTLLVVDGLDELNSRSEELFMDVINQRNDNLVVLCTCRPEKVSYFQTVVPLEFRIAHLRIIGIAENKREEFIRKYHDEMLRQELSTANTEEIVEYIKRSKTHMQKHYRLPLNLVILVWLWVDDKDRINVSTTSSELYVETHKLMKKKLIERLAHNEATKRVDLVDLHKRVEFFLSSMYREALVALRWDSFEKFLPTSVHQMKLTCTANDLPLKETLSAFLVVKIVEGEEQVSIPHKLLHEFYASLWVVQKLFDESHKRDNDVLFQNFALFLRTQTIEPAQQQSILNNFMESLVQRVEPQKPGSIRAVIEDLHSDDPSTVRMSKYQTLLLQVAGVLYTQHGSKMEECTARDIVQLLKEAELGKSDDNEWFELFDLVKNDSSVIKFASRHMRNSITVDEGHTKAALLVLKHVTPDRVKVNISSNHRNIPQFQDLFRIIAGSGCQVDAYFHHDFQHPGTTITDDSELYQLVHKCQVWELLGHLRDEALSTLPATTTFLNLAISSESHAKSIFPWLNKEIPRLPLLGLCLHITCEVSADAVSEVCASSSVCLWLLLTDVDDDTVGRACDVACNLLPSDVMYMDIRFPRATVTAAGWRQLMEGLRSGGATVGHITIPEDTAMDDDMYKDLRKTAHAQLRSDFRKFSGDKMWEPVMYAM